MKLVRIPLVFVSLLAATACQPSAAVSSLDRAAVSASGDDAVIAASEALASGQPWRASLLVEPALRDSSRRTPEAVLLAATAASRWGGWDQVRELLAPAVWMDTLFQGRGRALLARAELARRQDTAALEHARAALETADGELAEGERLVLLARALDRLKRLDSARVAYARAAELLPEVADWLYLRAAAVTADSGARADYYARLTGLVAPGRIASTDAQARERTGDLAGARRAYEALGDRTAALRLSLALASDSAARSTVRSALVELVTTRGGSSDARTAAGILDASFPALTAREDLVIARSVAQSGPLARAAKGFERAIKAGLATAEDRYAYASVLARLDRHDEAVVQFARIDRPAALAGSAAYARARSLVRGGRATEGRAALRRIAEQHPNHTYAASTALLLRADLATDARNDGEARSLLLELARRYPTSSHAAGARFRAAIIAFANGEPAVAAAELDSLIAAYPKSDEVAAARYWSGRGWLEAGDTATARARWEAVLQREPVSYYALLGARRLGRPAWVPSTAADSFIAVPALDSAMSRSALLERLGLDREAGWEHERVMRDADESVERMLATANAFRTRSEAGRSIRLAQRALDRGAPRDERVYRLLYPVVQTDALLAEAAAQRLDPAFVAALIRQESWFDPSATSKAGARGLMQLMPEVGRGIALGADFPMWDPVLLYQPDVNLHLGTLHLRELFGRYDEPVRILAAYNAGASRVERWATKVGMDDAELFAERIPYVETRDYVRIIQRNRALYQALYAWPEAQTAVGMVAR